MASSVGGAILSRRRSTVGSIARKIGITTQIVTDGDASGDVTSSVQDISAYRHLAVQADWDGDPVGDLQLQVSNDGAAWFDQGSPVATGGAAGVAMLTEQFAPWSRVRLFFDWTSGAGTLNAFATVKE